MTDRIEGREGLARAGVRSVAAREGLPADEWVLTPGRAGGGSPGAAARRRRRAERTRLRRHAPPSTHAPAVSHARRAFFAALTTRPPARDLFTATPVAADEARVPEDAAARRGATAPRSPSRLSAPASQSAIRPPPAGR
jgi:hypothetical protein